MTPSSKTAAVRQNSKIADVTYIVPLTQAEARRLTDRIKAHLQSADAAILELHEREGWKALGYRSWRECIQGEFDLTQSRGYQLLALARVRRNLAQLPSGNSTIVEKQSAPLLNEAQARVLAKVPAEQQRAVYEDAVSAAPNGKPTANQLEQMLTRPAPKPTPAGEKARSGEALVARALAHTLLDRASKALVDEVVALLMARIEDAG